jgi:hypothetical protein
LSHTFLSFWAIFTKRRLCTTIGAGAFFVLGLSSSHLTSAEPKSFFAQYPQADSAPEFLSEFTTRFQQASYVLNYSENGAAAIWEQLFTAQPPWFPFQSLPWNSQTLEFVNFGKSGFLMGSLPPEKPWSAVRLFKLPSLLGEARPLRVESLFAETFEKEAFSKKILRDWAGILQGTSEEKATAISLFWSGGLRCFAAAQGLSPLQPGLSCAQVEGDTPPPRCVPVANRRVGEVESLPGTQGRFCYFRRSRSDERISNGSTTSQLACQTEQGRWKALSVPGALALIPRQKKGSYLIYEPLFQPPKWSALDVDSAELTPLHTNAPTGGTWDLKSPPPSPQKATPSQPMPLVWPQTAIPQDYEGVYACQTESQAKHWDWHFTDVQVFEGQLEEAPDADRSFAFHLGQDKNDAPIQLSMLPWDALQAQAHPLTKPPPLGCVLLPVWNARCGDTLLKAALQIRHEHQLGLWKDALSPAVQHSLQALTLRALELSQLHLPSYALLYELQYLRDFFEKPDTQQKFKVPKIPAYFQQIRGAMLERLQISPQVWEEAKEP